jgi:hypothetical protein
MQNIVNRLDDMLLFQDVSINDVNEVVEKVGNIFKHTSASVFGSKCAEKYFCFLLIINLSTEKLNCRA